MFTTFLTFLSLTTYRFSAHLQLPTLQWKVLVHAATHTARKMINHPRSLSSLFALSPIDIVPKTFRWCSTHIWAFDYAHFGCVMDSKKHVMFPNVHYTPKMWITTCPNVMYLGSNKMYVFRLHQTRINWAAGQAREKEKHEYFLYCMDLKDPWLM